MATVIKHRPLAEQALTRLRPGDVQVSRDTLVRGAEGWRAAQLTRMSGRVGSLDPAVVSLIMLAAASMVAARDAWQRALAGDDEQRDAAIRAAEAHMRLVRGAYAVLAAQHADSPPEDRSQPLPPAPWDAE